MFLTFSTAVALSTNMDQMKGVLDVLLGVADKVN